MHLNTLIKIQVHKSNISIFKTQIFKQKIKLGVDNLKYERCSIKVTI